MNIGSEEKNVLIAGYYGFGNIGDEAILAAMLSDLRGGRQNLKFTVVSGNPLDTATLHNVRSILLADLPAIITAVRESDLVILGGGGLFQDYLGFPDEYLLTQNHAGISYYTGFPLLAAMYKKPCMLYSVGVGPLFSEKGERFTRLAFELASAATVRDVESMALLERLGTSPRKIRITADPAYNLVPDIPKANLILGSQQQTPHKESPLRIAVCARHWDVNISQEKWQQSLAEGLDRIAEDYDLKVIFVPFQDLPINRENDFLVAEAVLAKMKHKECAEILRPSHDPEEVAGVISLCDMVVGMRLHSLIFAMLSGVPVVGLVYDPKVKNILAQAKMGEYSIQLNELTPDLLYKTMSRVLDNKERINRLLHSRREELQRAAKENSLIALQLLDRPIFSTKEHVDNSFIWDFATKQTELLAKNEQVVNSLVAQLSERDQRVQALQEQLTTIVTSRSWRVATLLQRIRALLAPHGSRRARIARKAYSILQLPFTRDLPSVTGDSQRGLSGKGQFPQSKDLNQIEQPEDRARETGTVSPRIGIVIVSHNASTAVRITLASLRQIKNETLAKVVLVDNASHDIEREKIRSSFERHVQETSLPWIYIQQDKNLGFSGGNNVGIKYLLDDPEISHICLLNSDVIVTDHWLDRLLETGSDIVSVVTNKAESEQCIPIDYELSMDKCLDEQTESIPTIALSRINSFAQDWHKAWNGNLIEGEATFFCVLIARSVFQQVGLLDEAFYPGGYEDDDFCLRARQQGYKVQLARDVFIHHWGSASFGQLPYEYFNDRAGRNRKYLEDKHGIIRRRRAEKPFISYLADLQFAAAQKGDKILQRRFNGLYISQLGIILEHFESEFKNLGQMTTNSGRKAPLALQNQIEQARHLGNLKDTWRQMTTNAEAVFSDNFQPRPFVSDLISRLAHLAEDIWTRVECNFAMHAFLFPPQKSQDGTASNKVEQQPVPLPIRTRSRLSTLLWILKRGISFFWNLRGIVFFGGYPYPERQSDGYYQRIQMVDHLFIDRWRIYIESGKLPSRDHWFDHPEPKVLVLRPSSGNPPRRAIVRALVFMLVLRCRRIYFHSVFAMANKHVGWLMHIPGLTKVIDIHGVVPEEFRLYNDYYNAVFYERAEQSAVRHCNMIIVVSRAMEDYLRQKYRENLRGQVILFPMFPSYPPSIASRPYTNGKPVIVYAGGIQKWQQAPKMIDAMSRTTSLYEYRFYCPTPTTVLEMLPEQIRSQVIVDHKTRDELLNLYPECHYGFILREDNVVNRVACPTKLVEYLAMGIIPIVDTENIGDFKTMGMQFVALDELLQNTLPNEMQRVEMAKINLTVYERFRETYKQGSGDIRIALSNNRSQLRDKGAGLLTWVKDFFPPNTRRGQIARSLWAPIKDTVYGEKSSARVQALNQTEIVTIPPSLAECDVLVQVDNFEAGGLENVVLDLNDALISAGYKVVMMVLGKAGVGVNRARERGMTVLVGSSMSESYRVLIERIRPKLILAHYSIHGVELFHEQGIPFVQVIHNAYTWFDDRQRALFGRAANLTTAFIAVSEYARQYSIHRLGVDASRCIVLPCGIDGASFDAHDPLRARHELRGKYGIGEQDFVFLSVGAINHQKNHIATISAFANIAPELPLAKFVILGPAYEPQLLKEIERFVKKKGLRSRIIYAGSAPSAQGYYAMADAFVSASFFEGGQLNLLEALKSNLPIVTTNVGLAPHFKDIPGIQVIESPVDIFEFRGTIWQLTSNPIFEKRLATAMAQIYHDPRRPNLPVDLLRAFDRTEAYKFYIEVIKDLLKNGVLGIQNRSSSWLKELENFGSNS